MISQELINQNMLLKLIQEVPRAMPSDEKMCTLVFDLHKVRDYAVRYCNSREGIASEVFEVDSIVQDLITMLHEVWLFRKEVETSLDMH